MSVHNAIRFDISNRNHNQPDIESSLSELQIKGKISAIEYADDDIFSDDKLLNSLSAGLFAPALNNTPDIRKPIMSSEDAIVAIAKDFPPADIRQVQHLLAEPSAKRKASEVNERVHNKKIKIDDAKGVDYSELSGHSMRLAKLIDMIVELFMKLTSTDDERKSIFLGLHAQSVEKSSEKTKAAGNNGFWGALTAGIGGLALSGATALKAGLKTTEYANRSSKNINLKNNLTQKSQKLQMAANNPGLKPSSTTSSEAKKTHDQDLLIKADNRDNHTKMINNKLQGDHYAYQRSMNYTNIGHTASQATMSLSTNTAEMIASGNRAEANVHENISRIHIKTADNNADIVIKEGKLAQTMRDMVLQLLASTQQTNDKIISRSN